MKPAALLALAGALIATPAWADTTVIHAGAGSPDYGPYPTADPLWILETRFFSQRGFKQLILGV